MNKIATKFGFKATKVKDEKGAVIATQPARESFSLDLSVPSWEEVCAYVAGSKERDLIMESVFDTIYNQVRSAIADAIKLEDSTGVKADLSQTALAIDAMTWESIANMPAAKRGATKIDEESWTAFAEDYVLVMKQVSAYSEPLLKKQAEAFCDKFNSNGVRGKKKIIELLNSLLNQWFAASASAEEHFRVYQFLSNKAETALSADEQKVAEGLFGAVI